MADKSVAFDDDAEDERVVVAVSRGGDNAQAVATGFTLHPELLASAAPEGDESSLKGPGVADGVEEAEHQDLTRGIVLHDAGDEPVHFAEINLGKQRGHSYLSILFWVFVSPSVEIASRSKKPAGVWRRRAVIDPAISSGRSVKAVAVRRHGHPMMMVVMTMMAVDLHLKNNPKQDGPVCQIN